MNILSKGLVLRNMMFGYFKSGFVRFSILCVSNRAEQSWRKFISRCWQCNDKMRLKEWLSVEFNSLLSWQVDINGLTIRQCNRWWAIWDIQNLMDRSDIAYGTCTRQRKGILGEIKTAGLPWEPFLQIWSRPVQGLKRTNMWTNRSMDGRYDELC